MSLITFNGHRESLRNENLRRVHSFDNLWGYRLQWTRLTGKPCERHWAEEGSNLTPEHRVIHQHASKVDRKDLASTPGERNLISVDRYKISLSTFFPWRFIRFHRYVFTGCLSSIWQIHGFLSDPLRTCRPTNPLKHLGMSGRSFRKRRSLGNRKKKTDFEGTATYWHNQWNNGLNDAGSTSVHYIAKKVCHPN